MLAIAGKNEKQVVKNGAISEEERVVKIDRRKETKQEIEITGGGEDGEANVRRGDGGRRLWV